MLGGKGIEIRYLVFNLNLQPGDNDAQKLAIRRAAAYTIDREAIVNDVYDGTVQPLYSMIPQGLTTRPSPTRTSTAPHRIPRRPRRSSRRPV